MGYLIVREKAFGFPANVSEDEYMPQRLDRQSDHCKNGRTIKLEITIALLEKLLAKVIGSYASIMKKEFNNSWTRFWKIL